MPDSGGGDRGETLIEILVAVVIMGITLVAVIGGLLASIQFSDVHRKQATGGADVRSYAEVIAQYVAAGHYVECAGPGAYAPGAVGFTAPAGYQAQVTSVEYWDPSSRTFSASCAAAGLQRVTAEVASADGRATERAVIVLRKPCGQGSAC